MKYVLLTVLFFLLAGCGGGNSSSEEQREPNGSESSVPSTTSQPTIEPTATPSPTPSPTITVEATSTPTSTPMATATPTEASSLFLPPDGKIINIVGQNNGTIAEYIDAFDVHPAGVTSYIAVNAVDTGTFLDSLSGTANWGAGDINIPELAELYPNSILHIGVDAVEQLPAIVAGQLDEQIISLLNQLSALNRPVFMRWAWEFDGIGWTNYDPEEYKLAWVRMHQILHGERSVNGAFVDPNARNRIALVYQAAASCFSQETPDTAEAYAEHIEQWWPGAEYVDWFSLSYFAPHVCGTEFLNGAVLFANKPHINRPVMISESAPQGYMLGSDNLFGDKNYSINFDGGERIAKTGEEIYNEWFVDYRRFIAENNIRYVAYIADDWDKMPLWDGPPYDAGYWGDTELWEDDFIQNKWIEDMIDNEDVLNASDDLFCLIGYQTCDQ